MIKDIRILLFDLYTFLGWSFWIVVIGVSVYLESKFAIYALTGIFVALTLNVIDGIWQSGDHTRFWSIDPKAPRKQRMKEMRQIFIKGLD
jgi:hypothetical protein